ncbi:MAG: FkbM family methyltransferase, partial [Desulfobacterales bacterium]
MRITPKTIIHSIIWIKRHLIGQLKVSAISAIQQFIIPSDVCIDVGAHAGSWALPLSKLVYKGHVYAFEALPYYSSVLNIAFYLLQRKNITILNNAVVDCNRPVRLVWKDKNGNRLTGKTHVAGEKEKTF